MRAGLNCSALFLYNFTTMKKIEILKDFHQFKEGDIVEMKSDSLANGLLKGGWAKLYRKPKPKAKKDVDKSK